MASILGAILFFVHTTCGRPRDESPKPPAEAKATPVAIRPVRVLIASDTDRLRLRAPKAEVKSCDGLALPFSPPDDWFLATIDEPNGMRFDGSSKLPDCVELVPAHGTLTSFAQPYRDGWAPAYDYGGRLRILRTREGQFNVINEVEIDDYVSSVVANESSPSFVTEALRGQAIISRTFVLYLMGKRSSQPFDLSATQGAQVYKGWNNDEIGQRSREAAKYTRGIVCVYDDDGQEKLFATYYSSMCGGLSQSAEIFDGIETASPLRGGVKCDYCRIGPESSYRWGPVKLPASEVMTRVAQRFPAVWSLGELKAIETMEKTKSGRPTRLKLVGTTGEVLEVPAENFRLAIGASVIKSTDCHVRVSRGEVIWENGKGYGHGLGLCQWGMQGQAQQGKTATEILKFYYPGSRLSKAY